MASLHEPTHPRPLPGEEQASVRVLSVPLLGGARGGFMVPMHARKRKEALHEPPHSFSSSSSKSHPASMFSRMRTTTRTRTNRFKVPKHAQERQEAFHDLQGRAGVSPASVGNADGTNGSRWRARGQAGTLPYLESS